MLATQTPSHPPSLSRYTRRERSRKPFSYLDNLKLKLRLAPYFSRLGNRSPDMPKKYEDHSPKSHKSSNTRASSNLAVRQPSGTQNDGSARRRIERSGGGSEAPSASIRSNLLSSSRARGSELLQGSPQPADSAIGRRRTSPGAPTYIDNYLACRKKAFVKVFMAKVCEWLDDNVCDGEEAYDYEGETPGGSGPSGSRGIKRAASSSELGPGNKRQLRGGNRDGEDSESDETDDRKHNKKRMKADGDDNRPRFACPFYKQDPIRYKHHRSCVGPGWAEIHRVKEHLYRHHRLFTCTRCFENFKSEKDLNGHSRATVACQVRGQKSRKSDPCAGMDQETEKRLRGRRQPSKQDDFAKWYDIYYTLFPGMLNMDNPPSPWYDDPASSNKKSGTSDSDSEELKRSFERFLRRELPNMIQRELEKDVERCFEDLGDGLMDRLSVWIQDSSARCAKIFENIPSLAQAAASDDPETARASGSRAASPAQVPSSGGAAFGETLDHWSYGYPDFDFSTMNFDQFAMPSEFNSAYDLCDSGIDLTYGTGSMGDSSGGF